MHPITCCTQPHPRHWVPSRPGALVQLVQGSQGPMEQGRGRQWRQWPLAPSAWWPGWTQAWPQGKKRWMESKTKGVHASLCTTQSRARQHSQPNQCRSKQVRLYDAVADGVEVLACTSKSAQPYPKVPNPSCVWRQHRQQHLCSPFPRQCGHSTYIRIDMTVM